MRLLIGTLLCLGTIAAAQTRDSTHAVLEVRKTLEALLADEDTDGDTRITVDDARVPGTTRGDKRFTIRARGNWSFEVDGTYYLSNLLQELKLAQDTGADTLLVRPGRIFEPPTEHISRNIRDLYWDGLTRRIDEAGLPGMISDTKVKNPGGASYLYVPARDALALRYYRGIAARHPQWKLHVEALPPRPTGEDLRKLDGRHGLLTLALERTPEGSPAAVPFVVPGGRFNEMYGWDSYFIVLGLLADGRVRLAQSMVDNAVYEIRHYGRILNANRSYYLTRSQPPFLTSMALAVYRRISGDPGAKAWLRDVLEAAIDEYRDVWTSLPRLTSSGLSRYFDQGSGPPPEVEPGHFNLVFAAFAKKHGMGKEEFETAYRQGRIDDPDLDDYFVHDRSMRESGHDTSERLIGRCADLVTVDLNALLYKIEMDIAGAIDSVFAGAMESSGGRVERALPWQDRAARRKALVNAYLWDGELGIFTDYDVVKGQRTSYVSATGLYPLWAGLATPAQADTLVRRLLPQLELPGGVAGSSEASRGPLSPERPQRQWDFPHGWAPHQILAWQGLVNYGYDAAARRLAYRWLYTMTLGAVQYSGTVPEKFDVAARSHEVFAEYGNVGTTFSYITREGFGWSNASYQIGLRMLTPGLRDQLDRLVPPEWIFP